MSSYVEQDMIDRVVYAYLGSITEARDAYMNDGQYHAQIEFMQRLMEIFNLALKQEGLPTPARIAIMERIMLSAPDPTEAKRRIAMMKEMAFLGKGKINLDR